VRGGGAPRRHRHHPRGGARWRAAGRAPALLDQFYTAHRLSLAGVGFGVPRFGLTGQRFADVLTRLAQPAIVERAKTLAPGVITDAVQQLVSGLTA
jgi:hypothetical protein